jgi:hypothetical protein
MSLCSKSLGTSVLEYRSRLHILDGFEGVYNREPDRGTGFIRRYTYM